MSTIKSSKETPCKSTVSVKPKVVTSAVPFALSQYSTGNGTIGFAIHQ